MKYQIPADDYIHGGLQKDYYGPADVTVGTCFICGSDRNTHLYTERGNLGIVKCIGCNFIFTNPRAKDAESVYFGDAEIYFKEARLIFKGKKKHHRDRNYIFELEEIKKFKKSGKFLDIGCSVGFFLRKARDFGYDVQGVEPSPSLCNIAKKEFNLPVVNSYLESGTFPSGTFDVITMIDVFEHVTKPVELLNNAKSALKKDGILCIKVPNGNYNVLKMNLARLAGKESNHNIFNSYEHVGHYTPATMRRILSKTGFKIQRLIIPLPIHPPIWANLVGHYYQYPSPFILDWKRITLRNLFYRIGQFEKMLNLPVYFAPDLMFITNANQGLKN